MNYKEWLSEIDTSNPDECVESILEVCKKNMDSEQKLYAIQLLVHDSALVYNNSLKNKVNELKVKNENLRKQLNNKPSKKLIVKVKK